MIENSSIEPSFNSTKLHAFLKFGATVSVSKISSSAALGTLISVHILSQFLKFLLARRPKTVK